MKERPCVLSEVALKTIYAKLRNPRITEPTFVKFVKAGQLGRLEDTVLGVLAHALSEHNLGTISTKGNKDAIVGRLKEKLYNASALAASAPRTPSRAAALSSRTSSRQGSGQLSSQHRGRQRRSRPSSSSSVRRRGRGSGSSTRVNALRARSIVAPTSPAAKALLTLALQDPSLRGHHPTYCYPLATIIHAMDVKSGKTCTCDLKLNGPILEHLRRKEQALHAYIVKATPGGSFLMPMNWPMCSLEFNEHRVPRRPSPHRHLSKKGPSKKKFCVSNIAWPIPYSFVSRLAPGRHPVSFISSELDCDALVFFALVRVALPAEMVTLLGHNNQKNWLNSNLRQLRAARLSGVPIDDAIEDTQEVIDFLDPIVGAPIDIPCRGVHCDHEQPADLMTFLLSSFRSRYWNCPQCARPMNFESLYVDMFYFHLLRHPKAGVPTDGVDYDTKARVDVDMSVTFQKGHMDVPPKIRPVKDMKELDALFIERFVGRATRRGADVVVQFGSGKTSRCGSGIESLPFHPGDPRRGTVVPQGQEILIGDENDEGDDEIEIEGPEAEAGADVSIID